MKDDMQFSARSSLFEPVAAPASNSAHDAGDVEPHLDENFPWHRIRRMSRK